MTPEFLVIGHVAQDLKEGSATLGGTATYSSLTAKGAELQAAVVTSAESDFDLSALSGIEVRRIPSERTTTFENIYQEGKRVQRLHSRAASIQPGHVPKAWRFAPIVHLGPIAQEFGEGLTQLFPNSLIGLTPQGWMRQWDGEGWISPQRWQNADRILPQVDVLVLSEEDLADQTVPDEYAKSVQTLVVTQGDKGARLYHQGRMERFPAFVADTVDPTGAGDVFAAAFLVRLHETGNPFAAARFANCTASFVVEAKGIAGIPNRDQIEERLRSGELRIRKKGTPSPSFH